MLLSQSYAIGFFSTPVPWHLNLVPLDEPCGIFLLSHLLPKGTTRSQVSGLWCNITPKPHLHPNLWEILNIGSFCLQTPSIPVAPNSPLQQKKSQVAKTLLRPCLHINLRREADSTHFFFNSRKKSNKTHNANSIHYPSGEWHGQIYVL